MTNDNAPTTVILRKRYNFSVITLSAVRVLRKGGGLSLIEAARLITTLRRKGTAVARMPAIGDFTTFVRDLEDAGIWARRHAVQYRRFHPVEFEDWRIGMEFWVGSACEFPYRVTDVGTRTITAIHLNRPHDPSWYNGPPYAVPEIVFDENDLEVCYLEKPEGWME
jgi:hypothetical protein